MKSSIKKFLSTLCVVTSISGVVAPTLVSAIKPSGSESSCAAPDYTIPDDFFDLMYSENHRKWYRNVMSLRRRDCIDNFSAFMLILINQTACYFRGKEFNASVIRNAVISKDWKSITDEIRYKARNYVFLEFNCMSDTACLHLSANAFELFNDIESGKKLLDESLLELDPFSIAMGLRF